MKKFCSLFVSVAMTLSLTTTSFAKSYTDKSENVNSFTDISEEISTAAANKIIAFPGAEGGGKYATGGRGGSVYYVTNLNDSGTGSFRDAVSSSNRIVVFKVGGTIELKSDVSIKGNITVAGQTAPGGQGITLKNYKVGLGGNNIILRYISSRPGERGTSADYDAFGGGAGSNSIVDHCSIGWANDEQWGLYSNNVDYTTQWTLVGPSNSFSYHSKGIHGFAVMYGKGNFTWHHNMIAHNVSRCFRGKVEKTMTGEFVNNVIYNWGYQTTYGTLGHLNYVGNYLKMGPSTAGGYHFMAIGNSGSSPENYLIYLKNNKFVKPDGTPYVNSNGVTINDNNWAAVTYGSGKTEENSKSDSPFAVTINGENVAVAPNAESADVAFEKVLKYAGAGISPDERPAIDKQVMEEARTGTGSMTGARPKSEANSTQLTDIERYKIECGVQYKYPEKVTSTDVIDTDKDGMPDDWELKRGLDPNTDDSTGDYCGKGYTNIEYYLNDLTINSFPEGTVTLSPISSIKVTVDQSAPEVTDDINALSFQTITKAVEYIKNNSENITGVQEIYVAPGTYSEDIVIDKENTLITLKEGATGEAKIKSIKVNSDLFFAEGVTFGEEGSTSPGITVSGDKASISNCKIYGASNTVSLLNNSRAYFENCYIQGSDNVVSGVARAVFNNCELKSNGGGSFASSETIKDNQYAFMFVDCVLDVIGNDKTALAAADSEYSSVVYWNCKMSDKVAVGEDRFKNMNSSKVGKAVLIECNSKDSSGNAIDLNSAKSSFENIISEAELRETVNPYNHLKARLGEADDGWNPGGFDSVTPQECLQEFADSISFAKVITKDTPVVTYFENDADINLSWQASDSSCFKDNTILIGEYGSGVKTLTLKVTVSKDGLKDIVKEFTMLVSSESQNSEGITDFEDEIVGELSNHVVGPTSYEPNEKITWGVADEINGVNFENMGNFFKVKQLTKTDVAESVDPGKGIYDFTYNFGEQSEKVIEVGFDIYAADMGDGYFETYVRGSNTVGQLRFTSDGVLANQNSSTKSSLTSVAQNWYKFKIIVNTIGLSNGTEPKIDYCVYDMDGNKIASLTGASPAKAFTAADAAKFVPNRLVFRPNRTTEQCEFYLDNIYFKDLTSIAKQDADDISENTVLNMSNGMSLPKYGNRLSDIRWNVIEGASELVNSDGTINYDKCVNAVVKVKGVVQNGSSSLKGSSETEIITLNIIGTGTSNPDVDEKSFSDTEDFSSWIKEYNQASIGISLDNTENIGGNSSSKILLPNKAVFKKTNNPISAGKAAFSTDFYTDSSGRTFRIYLENAHTNDDGKGYGSAGFVNENIFYHITDIGGKTYVVTSDSPSVKENTSSSLVELGTLEPNKWYRINIDLDFDSATAETSVYMHGSDGAYNPENLSETPVGTVNSNLISKMPLSLKQMRLVKTATGNVYFDNVSLTEEAKESVSVTGVVLDKNTLELTKGDVAKLKATVSPSNADNPFVNWSSSNEEVATVDLNGNVRAVGEGSADITVTTTDGNFTAVCKVTVKDTETPDVSVTGVTLDKTSAELKEGESLKLTATISPDKASNTAVSWSSSNEKVATVDKDGNVKAVGEGSADITVTTTDGNFTAVCKVTVKKAISGTLKGDANGDGEITIEDASLALQYVLNKSMEGFAENGIENIQLSGDSITAKDVSMILQKALNSSFEF